jgi:hypothetical protein
LLAQWRELASLDDKIERLKGEKKALQRDEKKAAQEAEKLKATAPVDPASAVEAPATPAKPEPESTTPPAPEKPKRTSADVQDELDEAFERQKELEKIADSAPKAYAVMDGKGVNARIQKKGEPRALGEEVPRGFLTILGGQDSATGGEREWARPTRRMAD